MPDVMIAPTQNPIRSSTGNANALRHSDSSGQATDSASPEASAMSESPFAKVLRNQSEKATVSPDGAGDATTRTATTPSDAGNQLVAIDLSALLQVISTIGTSGNPFPGRSQTPLTTQPDGEEDKKPLPDGQGPAIALSAQLIAATPATPVVAETPASRVSIDTQGSRKADVEAQAEESFSAQAPKAGDANLVPGKITPNAAINADVARRGEDVKQTEVPANDFPAVLERAVATATDVTSHGNRVGSSSTLRVETPLGQSGWRDEIGQKLTWMVSNNRQQADLVLTPPHLGRVEVSLTMSGDQATAIFTSANPAVREALENSLHRLREVLADAGVSLGQTQVGSESPDRSRPGNEPVIGEHLGLRHESAIASPLMEAIPGTSARAGRGMIDIFA